VIVLYRLIYFLFRIQLEYVTAQAETGCKKGHIFPLEVLADSQSVWIW
jgi:hypothetical protein